MYSPRTEIKTTFYLTFSLLFLILYGCANTPLSNIKNIRQIDNTAETRDSQNLTLMTFNIRAGGGIEKAGMSPFLVKATKENLMKIVAAINSVDPDIIGLQEVRGFNQAKFIAEQLNLNYVYITHGQGSSSSRWGLALLSKFPISKARTKSLSHGSYRRILVCSIPIGEEYVSVINVHISLSDLDYDDTTYEAQFRAIEKTLKSIEGPIVLMGDLNRSPTDRELKPIQEKLVDTCLAINPEEHCWVRDRGTFAAPAGRHLWIDYIFINPDFFEVKKTGLVPKEHWDASDHKAFFAEVILKESFDD